MINPITEQSIIEMCNLTLADCEDPIRRRDSLLILNFILKGEEPESERVEKLAKELLKEDEDANVRRYAAWVLSNLFAKDILKNLAEALADENWEVRFDVVEAIGDFPDDENKEKIIPLLLRALEDSRPEVQLRAAFHLSCYDGSDVRTEIRKIHPEWEDDYD
jgi:hypothetical protein